MLSCNINLVILLKRRMVTYMAIDASSMMLALSGLYGNNSYGNNLLTNTSSTTGSFQNILLSALLGGGSALTTDGCPYCAAIYGKSDGTSATKTGLKSAGNAKATGQELNEYFQEAEEKYGVSADLLRAIAKVESDYDINAQGESGAQGLMQLMPAMAERMDIEDIYDAKENIMGAARSLARKLEFNGGDVAQAVRSYHAGNVSSALYKGEDVDLGLDEYVERVLKYADEDLTAEVASSQSGNASGSGTTKAGNTESVFSADDAKYLAEMAKMQMQMSSLAAFNTSLSGSGSSGGLI